MPNESSFPQKSNIGMNGPAKMPHSNYCGKRNFLDQNYVSKFLKLINLLIINIKQLARSRLQISLFLFLISSWKKIWGFKLIVNILLYNKTKTILVFGYFWLVVSLLMRKLDALSRRRPENFLPGMPIKSFIVTKFLMAFMMKNTEPAWIRRTPAIQSKPSSS